DRFDVHGLLTTEVSIVRTLENDVRMQIRRSVTGGTVIKLSCQNRCVCSWRYDRRTAGGSADVLLRILERHAVRKALGRMTDEAELCLPRPDQTHLVVRVHDLRKEDVCR